MPLFSIVIPTKNRPELITQTVLQILGLKFQDMEVVVIDNSDTETTSQALAQIKNERLRVVRTGKLSMPDNWEAGYCAANGEYIFLIGDKVIINPFVLPRLRRRIEQYSPEVLAVNWYPCAKVKGVKYRRDGWAAIPSEVIIEKIRNFDFIGFCSLAPIGYKAILSRDFVRKVQAKFGRMTFPLAPDYTAGYMTLFNCREVHYYTGLTNRLHPGAPSNGISSEFHGKMAQSFLADMNLAFEDTVKFAPLPIVTVSNSIVSDFFHMAEIAGLPYRHEWIDKTAYARFLFEDLMSLNFRLHLDISDRLKSLYGYMEQNNLFAEKAIIAVMEKYDLSKIEARANAVNKLKALIARYRIPVISRLKMIWLKFVNKFILNLQK
ncbi:MAG: glycosyltransferase [Victivallaceae bacterium]|jgi:glycosyltransferase involved in cell wall biosynthesis